MLNQRLPKLFVKFLFLSLETIFDELEVIFAGFVFWDVNVS